MSRVFLWNLNSKIQKHFKNKSLKTHYFKDFSRTTYNSITIQGIQAIQEPLATLIRTNLQKKFSTSFTEPWILTSTHKNHIIFIQYPSHKCLTEKSCLDCLRILIMSWLFQDVVVIVKEIMSWLFKDPINNGLAQFDHAQSNSKK